MKTLKVGTRGSALARTQTEQVLKLLRKKFPSVHFQIHVIQTAGDKIVDAPLAKVAQTTGAKAFFTKEIEDALLRREIDFAVHSMKDLGSVLPRGLTLAAVPQRLSARDVLITARQWTWAKLPRGARVGTSAVRRKMQLRFLRPDLNILDLRGNLDTRLAKLRQGKYDAVMVAEAGLKRLLGDKSGRLHKIYPPESSFVPAAGQGALALQARSNDRKTLKILRVLDDAPSRRAIACERAFLAELGAGCQAPCGVFASSEKSRLKVRAVIGHAESGERIYGELSGPLRSPEALGKKLARALFNNGGRELLRSA